MFQTMEGNARPHRIAECVAEEAQDHAHHAHATQAELLSALHSASDNIMRLAGKLRAEHDTDDAAASIAGQHALAQALIGRLLALPASQA